MEVSGVEPLLEISKPIPESRHPLYPDHNYP